MNKVTVTYKAGPPPSPPPPPPPTPGTFRIEAEIDEKTARALRAYIGGSSSSALGAHGLVNAFNRVAQSSMVSHDVSGEDIFKAMLVLLRPVFDVYSEVRG